MLVINIYVNCQFFPKIGKLSLVKLRSPQFCGFFQIHSKVLFAQKFQQSGDSLYQEIFRKLHLIFYFDKGDDSDMESDDDDDDEDDDDDDGGHDDDNDDDGQSLMLC